MTQVATPTPSAELKRLLPWVVAVAFFMEALDTTILNTAVPTIAQAMAVPPLSVKVVLASYTLSLAVFTPLSGWLADRLGTRRVFATAIALFTLGSVLCGLANSLEMLVVCRVLQGMGGAMMVPVGRMTLAHTYDKSDLVRVMSFVAVPTLIGPMVGPVSGGLIVTYFDWRGVFYVNVPVGLAGLWLVLRLLPDYRATESHPLDVVGLGLFGGGIGVLSYVLEVFGDHRLTGAETLALLGLATVLLAGYGRRAATRAFPLLDLGLFRVRTFRAAVAGGFVTRLGLAGVPFLFPLLFQVGLGFSPVVSGLLMVPQVVAAIGLKVVAAPILSRLGYRTVLVGNTALAGLMILSFSTVGVGTPFWLIILQAFVLGLFTSMQYTAMNTLIFADIPTAQTNAASTISTTAQQLAISFGVAGAGLLAAIFVPESLHSHAETIIAGLHWAFLILGGLTILAAASFFSLAADDGAALSHHDAARHHPRGEH